MEDNITVPFPAGPWKFESRRTGDGTPAATLLVTTASSVGLNDRVIFALRPDWLGLQTQAREHARALIENAPDLFVELASAVDALEDHAVLLREAGATAHATEIERRIAKIRETLARATTIDRPAMKSRYVVGLIAPGINVAADNLELAKEYAREDARKFAGGWTWKRARSAIAAPYLDLTGAEDVDALIGFVLECTCQTKPDYTFALLMNVVVEAESAEAANAEALALVARNGDG